MLIKDIQVPRVLAVLKPILIGFAPGRMDENTSRRFAFHLKFQKLGKSNMSKLLMIQFMQTFSLFSAIPLK